MKETKDKQKKNTFRLQFFYRINPDAEGFDIFFEISKMQGYISQSNKKN